MERRDFLRWGSRALATGMAAALAGCNGVLSDDGPGEASPSTAADADGTDAGPLGAWLYDPDEYNEDWADYGITFRDVEALRGVRSHLPEDARETLLDAYIGDLDPATVDWNLWAGTAAFETPTVSVTGGSFSSEAAVQALPSDVEALDHGGDRPVYRFENGQVYGTAAEGLVATAANVDEPAAVEYLTGSEHGSFVAESRRLETFVERAGVGAITDVGIDASGGLDGYSWHLEGDTATGYQLSRYSSDTEDGSLREQWAGIAESVGEVSGVSEASATIEGQYAILTVTAETRLVYDRTPAQLRLV